jgi:hypothetical protein
VVADRPPSPILKITFDASKVALLAGRRVYKLVVLFVLFFDLLMDLLRKCCEKSEIRAQLWGNCASGGKMSCRL